MLISKKIHTFTLPISLLLIASVVLVSCTVYCRSIPAKSMNRVARLKRIGMAIESYYDKHGNYPPAAIYDEQGVAMHSWRALLLPFIDEQLANEYRYGEPWDSESNSRLWNRIPEVFTPDASMVKAPYSTDCLAVTGDDTAWPVLRTRKRSDFVHGASSTIFLIACPNETEFVNWLEPKDLHKDALLGRIKVSAEHPCYVLFGHGFVEKMTELTPDTLRLFRIDSPGYSSKFGR